MKYNKEKTYNDELNFYNQSKFLIAETAYLYYFEGLLQSEISKKLGISISTTSRLLNQAKSEGIIEIKMSSLHKESIDISDYIKNKYNLKRVIVAPVTDKMDNIEVKKAVALEGARYIQRIVLENDILGVAWGGTMYHLINFLNPSQKTNTKSVTLHGSIYMSDYDLDVQTLVSKIAKAFSGKRYSMSIHSLLSSKEAVDIMKQEPHIQKVYDMFNEITISVSGVGSLKPIVDSPLVSTGYINENELNELIEEEVCGDIMLRFFDENGKECDTSLKDRTFAIPLKLYKQIPNKIIVASGEFKKLTVKSALKGDFVNTLIIDSLLAKSLI